MKRVIARTLPVLLLLVGGVSPLRANTSRATADTRLSNAAIRIDVDEDGLIALGTTGGAVAINGDEDKQLLFGWYKDSDASSTSFTSLRIQDGADGAPADFRIQFLPKSGATSKVGESIQNEWVVSDSVRIRQTLSIMNNPFSGLQDLMRVEYNVSNLSGGPKSIGIRAMLDVMVGNNDAAPYFIAGKNRSNLQQEFVTPNIPAYYVSFESNAFEANSLKGLGLLSGFGMTTPDRVQISNWRRVTIESTEQPWLHTVVPTDTHGDSAVLAYWNPRLLTAGQSATFVTAYGLAGQGGGSMWLVAPLLVQTGTSEVSVQGWVNNTTTEDVASGAITLTLPAGMRFKTGEQASKPITLLKAGSSAQNNWRVEFEDPAQTATYTLDALATLSGQTDVLTATARMLLTKTQRVLLPLALR